jgi:hypothetical protein
VPENAKVHKSNKFSRGTSSYKNGHNNKKKIRGATGSDEPWPAVV